MNSTANVYLPTPECHQLRQLLLDELALGRLLQHQLEQEGQLLARMEPEQLQRAGQSKNCRWRPIFSSIHRSASSQRLPACGNSLPLNIVITAIVPSS